MAYRENFDLFSKFGRRNFFKRGIFGDKWARVHVVTDTLGHHICSVINHSKETFENDGKIICMRCNKSIKNKEVEVWK